MSSPGGEADKDGNRYESIWTISAFIDVIDGVFDSIYLEPKGPHEVGFEFLLSKDGSKTGYQSKRQHAGGHWTVNLLRTKKVLKNFFDFVSGTNNFAKFVSIDSAPQLRELADRSRKTKTLADFLQLISSRESYVDSFPQVCAAFGNASGELAFLALQKMFFSSMGEIELSQAVKTRIGALVEGDQNLVFDLIYTKLATLSGKTLHANDIWELILESGHFKKLSLVEDRTIIGVAEKANHLFCESIRARKSAVLPDIERATVDESIEEYLAGDKKVLLLTGDAGSGKSHIAAKLVERLQGECAILLALRLDAIELNLDVRALGRSLFNRNLSIIQILAAASGGRQTYLVLDQLDALSSASGRDPQHYETINSLLQEAAFFPNVRLIFGCRIFDVKNDSRFAKLSQSSAAKLLTIEKLSDTEVKAVVRQRFRKVSEPAPNLIEILRIPLNLSLLFEAVPAESSLTDIRTTKDLFDKYWDNIGERIKLKSGAALPVEAVDSLLRVLYRRMKLVAPLSLFDDVRVGLNLLASEGFLTIENSESAGNQVRFFHESLFDYSFARRLVSVGTSLNDFLLGGEQHLFARASVRQILQFRRDSDFEVYLRDLSETLSGTRIRFHIKSLIITWLVDLTNPTEQEYALLKGINGLDLGDVDAYLSAGRGWREFFLSRGSLSGWLSDLDETSGTRACYVISNLMPDHEEEIARMLNEALGLPGFIRTRLRDILNFSVGGRTQLYRDLICTALQSGLMDPVALKDGFRINFVLDKMVKERNIGSVDILKAALLRAEKIFNAAESRYECFLDSDVFRGIFERQLLSRIANLAPSQFLDSIFPIFLRLVNEYARSEKQKLRRDTIWYRHYLAERELAFKDTFLNSIAKALETIAMTDVEFFRVLSVQLVQSELSTCNLLWVQTVQINPILLDDSIVDIIVENPERLQSGGYTASRALIAKLAPRLSISALARLQSCLINFRDFSEWTYYEVQRADRLRVHHSLNRTGRTQLNLLTALPDVFRSENISRRIAELKRKFPDENGEDKVGSSLSWVRSPIAADVCAKLHGEPLLGAVKAYSSDRQGAEHEFSKGGAQQLASELGRVAEREPCRYAQLLIQFDETVSEVYPVLILNGLASSEIESNDAIKVLRHYQSFKNPRTVRAALSLLEKVNVCDIDEELIEWLGATASNENDLNDESEIRDDFGDIGTAGLNSLRGYAFFQIAKLLFRDKKLSPSFRRFVAVGSADKDPAVRIMVCECLLAYFNFDHQDATDLFFVLANGLNDEALGSHQIEMFIHHAYSTDDGRFATLLDSMKDSPFSEASLVASRQLAVGGLRDGAASHAINKTLLAGTKDQRLGLAQILAANYEFDVYKSACELALIELFDDTEAAIRTAARNALLNLENVELAEYEDFFEFYVLSATYKEDLFGFARVFERNKNKLPSNFIRIFNSALDQALKEKDAGYRFDIDSAINCTIRYYAERKSQPEEQSKALDLLDRLFAFQPNSYAATIVEIDRSLL